MTDGDGDADEAYEVDLRSPTVRGMLRRGAEDPEGMWGDVAGELHWFERWDDVLREVGPADFSWFE